MPRWQTMIEPACASWPSPALTPSRWPTLSRPFLELEPAFLWAIGYSSFIASVSAVSSVCAAGLAALVGFAVAVSGFAAAVLLFAAVLLLGAVLSSPACVR